MTAEHLQQEIFRTIGAAGLSAVLVEGRSQVLDLAGDLFVEIVVSDTGREQAMKDLVSTWLNQAHQQDVSLVVRAIWKIAEIEKPVPAYAPDGGIRAAVLIPVTLVSGNESTRVTVAVTKLAEMELDRILGRKTHMQDVAGVVVSNALRRGGQSYWDPRAETYLEVGSSIAPQISRLLKRTA